MAGPDAAIAARTEIAQEALIRTIGAAMDGRVKAAHGGWRGPCEPTESQSFRDPR
jgi:hypothetical protein